MIYKNVNNTVITGNFGFIRPSFSIAGAPDENSMIQAKDIENLFCNLDPHIRLMKRKLFGLSFKHLRFAGNGMIHYTVNKKDKGIAVDISKRSAVTSLFHSACDMNSIQNCEAVRRMLKREWNNKILGFKAKFLNDHVAIEVKESGKRESGRAYHFTRSDLEMLRSYKVVVLDNARPWLV